MERVLLLIENNYEDTEALYPYYRMKEAGFEVVVVGAKAGTYSSKHGYPLRAEMTPGEIDVKKFKALLIPGGQAPDRMRLNPGMVALVKQACAQGLVVGAICHGPQMLIEADAVRGKKATCYASVKTDLVNAGAKYEDRSVVVDGRLVTSRTPDDLPDFCRAVLERLSSAG